MTMFLAIFGLLWAQVSSPMFPGPGVKAYSGGGGGTPTLMDSKSVSHAGTGTITTAASSLCNGATGISVAVSSYMGGGGGAPDSFTLQDSTNGGSTWGVNTYTAIGHYGDAQLRAVGIYHVAAPTTSTNMKWRISNGAGTVYYPTMLATCWSNTAGAVTDHNGAGSSTSTTTLSTGAVTPTGAGQLVLAAFSWQYSTLNSYSPTCTEIYNTPDVGDGVPLAVCHLITNSATDVTATFATGSNPRAGMIISVNHN